MAELSPDLMLGSRAKRGVSKHEVARLVHGVAASSFETRCHSASKTRVNALMAPPLRMRRIESTPSAVMRGHSRTKDGVASLAYVPRISLR